MPRINTAVHIAAHLRDLLPSAQREAEEAGREIVLTSVWLVGLSSALLSFLAVNPQVLAALHPTTRLTLVAALASSVVLGVAQRLAYQAYEIMSRSHLHGLKGYLAGYLSEGNQPPASADWWTRAVVIEKFQRHFELDYGFLDEYEVPEEACRAIYRKAHDSWAAGDNRELEEFKSILAAYLGKTAEEMFQPNGEARLRTVAGVLAARGRVATRLYWLAALGFVIAVVLLAVAVGATMRAV